MSSSSTSTSTSSSSSSVLVSSSSSSSSSPSVSSCPSVTDDARLEGVVWFSFFVVVGERNDDDGLNVDEDEELLVLYPAVGEKETWQSPSISASSF